MSQNPQEDGNQPTLEKFSPFITHQQAVIQDLNPDTGFYQISLQEPDGSTVTKELDLELAEAAGLQFGDQLEITYTYQPGPGEFQITMDINSTDEGQEEQELENYQDSEVLAGVIHRIGKNYTQVNIAGANDGDEGTDKYSLGSDMVTASGMRAGDQVKIINITKVGPGKIKRIQHVEGNIQTPEQL